MKWFIVSSLLSPRQARRLSPPPPWLPPPSKKGEMMWLLGEPVCCPLCHRPHTLFCPISSVTLPMSQRSQSFTLLTCYSQACAARHRHGELRHWVIWKMKVKLPLGEKLVGICSDGRKSREGRQEKMSAAPEGVGRIRLECVVQI